MMNLTRWVERKLGRGDAATTVPVLDGRLKANTLLDKAEVVAEFSSPRDLAADRTGLLVTDGSAVLRLSTTGAVTRLAEFKADVTALTTLEGGGFAAAVGGREVHVVGGPRNGQTWSSAEGVPFNSINALFERGESIIATDGSTKRHAEQWSHDLLEQGRTGRVIELRDGGAEALRSKLGYAFGVCCSGGSIWFSESWRHRVERLTTDGRHATVWDRLPGYPGRMSPAASGGVWLSLFARRTQLVEFVLREPAFRKRMMRDIEPQYWIAPAMRSGASFKEPIQAGGIRNMGVLKPWAPPRSYGLLVRLSPEGLPDLSIHSRVGGLHHGIVAAAEHEGALYILSQGAGRVLRLSLERIESELGA